MSELTEEDRNSILYFIREKGDITRWCDYEKNLEAMKSELPYVMQALSAVKQAERLLELELDRIWDEKS